MNPEQAKKIQTEINKKELEQWIKKDPHTNTEENFKPNNLIRKFNANGKDFKLIDSRKMVVPSKVTDPITEEIAILSIKLMFLDTILKNYETSNEKDKNTIVKYYKINK